MKFQSYAALNLRLSFSPRSAEHDLICNHGSLYGIVVPYPSKSSQSDHNLIGNIQLIDDDFDTKNLCGGDR